MSNHYDLNESDNKNSDELINEGKKSIQDLEKTSENYYDFNFNDVPTANNDQNLNKPLDLSRKIQDENNNKYNNYNSQYQNNQSMNYNSNIYNSGLNSNPYTNYNNQYNQNRMYNNNMNYNGYQSSVQSNNISRAPLVLGILSGIAGLLSLFGSVIVLVFILVFRSNTIEPSTLFDDPYTGDMLLSIIPVWIFACIVGIAAIVFAIISTRYIKAATIGFLVCTILFFLMIFPGYGGTFLSFILSLIATIISYGNMKKFINS